MAPIEAFVDNQKEEDVQLELKTVSSSDMDRDDRRNFAKALSRFVDSSGGFNRVGN